MSSQVSSTPLTSLLVMASVQDLQTPFQTLLTLTVTHFTYLTLLKTKCNSFHILYPFGVHTFIRKIWLFSIMGQHEKLIFYNQIKITVNKGGCLTFHNKYWTWTQSQVLLAVSICTTWSLALLKIYTEGLFCCVSVL